MIPPAALWGQVKMAMQQGRLDAAKAGAEQILRIAPRHPGALHILGVICLQHQQMPEALRWLRKASQADQRNAMIWATLGYACFETASYRDAVEAFRKAASIDPRAHPALHGLGKTLQALGRHQEAAAALGRAIAVEPRNPDYLNDRGVALMESGAAKEAVQDFDAALALAPEFFGAFLNKGLALKQCGDGHGALAALDQAIALNPSYAPAHNNRAAVLLDLKEVALAMAAADRAIALTPDFAAAWNNKGLALLGLEDASAALESFECAARLDPTNAAAHYNTAGIYWQRGEYPKAAEAYRHCLRTAPQHLVALNDLGLAEAALGNPPAAIECYDRVLRLAPDFAEAQFNKSLTCLLLGNFAEGWRLWEARKRKKTPVGYRDFGLPLWTGAQEISGRHILLHWEQGFGDTVQFIRYAPMVQAKGADVALLVQPELAPLIRRVMPGIRITEEAPAEAALQCPLMSLPRAFGTLLGNIPPAPVWPADETRSIAWRARLGHAGRPRIGFSWRGSAGHGNDRNRSVGVQEFLPLMDEKVAWFGIQKGMPDSDREALSAVPALRVFDSEVTDFEDTAALVSEMDLIITVDTSLAHLAGSMGRECWVMLPFNPDWRWLLDRRDSPWYPSIRLFRQKRIGDWADVMAELRAALQQYFG
jgi:tetratricopeptide (TPR) repeat protein